MYCPSTLRLFLHQHLQYGAIKAFTWNFVGGESWTPDPTYVNASDVILINERMKSGLPFVTSSLFKLAVGVGAPKYLYQPQHCTSLATHGSESIDTRPVLRIEPDAEAEIFFAHYRTIDTDRMSSDFPDKSEFWVEAIRDTSVADTMMKLKMPLQSPAQEFDSKKMRDASDKSYV